MMPIIVFYNLGQDNPFKAQFKAQLPKLVFGWFVFLAELCFDDCVKTLGTAAQQSIVIITRDVIN